MSGQATVIFDFDGTLANSVDLMVKLYNEHVNDYGYLPVERSEFPELRRLGYKKAMRLKKIKVRHLPSIVLHLGREMKGRMNEVAPYEGIVDALESLRRDGFRIGVLTSNQASLVKEFFKVHNFPPFDFVVSEKTLFGKDKALKKIIKRYDLHNNQVLYVGDEPRDVHASNKAGVLVVGVTWGLAGKEGFEKTPPDVMVQTPKELVDQINLISQA